MPITKEILPYIFTFTLSSNSKDWIVRVNLIDSFLKKTDFSTNTDRNSRENWALLLLE